MPKVLFCDGCLENHKCATAQNPQPPLDPKNLARLREVRENLDAALGFVAAAAERRASFMEPASPPAPMAPVASEPKVPAAPAPPPPSAAASKFK